jgi:RNA polymerase sigma-70 factor (ECF subfamily)
MAAYCTLTDQDLTALLKNKDADAYEEIYSRYWLVLYRHAWKMLQEEEEARDVVQDIFLMIWNKSEMLNLAGSLSSFLYAAVRNKVLDLYRRKKVMETHMASLGSFDVETEATTDHLVRIHELSVIIEHEISLLPERMREVFELRRKFHLSYKEIAGEMGISELTVKTQMNKAIKQLKVKLGPYLFSSCFPFL